MWQRVSGRKHVQSTYGTWFSARIVSFSAPCFKAGNEIVFVCERRTGRIANTRHYSGAPAARRTAKHHTHIGKSNPWIDFLMVIMASGTACGRVTRDDTNVIWNWLDQLLVSIRSWAHVGLTFKRGWVIRKPVNANPGLKVNRSTIFFPVYKGFTALVLCILRLSKLKTESQTIYRKPQRKVKKLEW